jgi:hypothetical protein
MPAVALVAPVLVPLVAAGLILLFGLAGVDIGRAAAGAGAAGSALALLILWIPVRSTLELDLGPLGFGQSLDLRVDAVGFAFGLIVVVPAAVLLALQPRTWQEAVIATLGLAAAVAAVEAGGVLLTALAGGTAAALAAVQLDTEEVNPSRPRWGALLAAWPVLSLAGVILLVRGGTVVYGAVPVASFTGPVFALAALAALLVSGLLPWRTWPAQVWSRPSLRAAGIAVATLYPLGFYLLVRAYEMGNGQYPAPGFQTGLSVLGVLIAAAAAVRAQAAATQREFLSEVVTGFGGFALMTIALGTPLGLAAGLVTLGVAAAMTACIALLPDAVGYPSMVAIAAAAGLPPSVAFGARILGLDSTFEGGEFLGLVGVAGAGTWALWMLGAARALGLSARSDATHGERFPRVATAIASLTFLAGPALPAIQTFIANPAQAEVMPAADGTMGGGLTSVITVSSVMPALTLFVPLLVLGALAYFLAGTATAGGGARPAPLPLPGAALAARLRSAIRSAAVPETYRSLVSLRAVEAAATSGKPVLWLAALVALTFAITRQ